jgi:small-conductance mechanosensitive channel
MKRSVFLYCAAAVLAAMTSEASTNRQERLRQVVEDIEATQTLIRGVTNDAHRAILQRRIELAEREADQIRRLIALSEEESRVMRNRGGDEQDALREMLNGIDGDEEKALARAEQLNREIRSAAARRAELEESRDRLLASSSDVEDPIKRDTYVARHASALEELANLDALIEALSGEREAADLAARLAANANRIRDALRGPSTDMRMTIRNLMDRGRVARERRKSVDGARDDANRLASRAEEARETTALTRQRINHIQEEIDVVRARADVERDAIDSGPRESRTARRDAYYRTRRLADRLVKEGELLDERLRHRERLQAGLESAQEHARRLESLLDAEVRHLERRLAKARSAYLVSVLAPLGVALLIIAAYLAASWYVFPRVYALESIFVARRLGSYLTALLVLVVLCFYFLEDLKAIAAVLGLAGAAVIIALSDLCSAFAGWFIIVSSRKIRVGDRVEIDGCRGDVIDIQLLRTTLVELNNWLEVDEPTGRIVAFPNNFIFKLPVFNCAHIHPYVWNKIDVTVTFETPAEKAERMLLEVLSDETREEFAAAEEGAELHEKRYGSKHKCYCAPRVHSVIADSGVTFSVFYVCHFRQVAGTRDRINRRIIDLFNREADLDFAYPTERHIPTPPPGHAAAPTNG